MLYERGKKMKKTTRVLYSAIEFIELEQTLKAFNSEYFLESYFSLF